MSGQVDPWDAMVQSDDSDQEYIPTGADGIDDSDLDFEPQDDTSGEDGLGGLGGVVLSPCRSFLLSREFN